MSFCSQRITGAPQGTEPGARIRWTAYHTADAPGTVVAWYRSRLPAANHQREGGEDVWRLPLDQHATVLRVSAPVTTAPPFINCSLRPPASARALIVISTMTRP